MSDFYKLWLINNLQKVSNEYQVAIVEHTPTLEKMEHEPNVHQVIFQNEKPIFEVKQTYDIIIINFSILKNENTIDFIHQCYNYLNSGGHVYIYSCLDLQNSNIPFFWDSEFETNSNCQQFLKEKKDFEHNLEHRSLGTDLKFLRKYFKINYQITLSEENSYQLNITINGIKKDNIIVQSLWIGSPLSNLEKLSIKSFLKNGHDFHLYIYEPIEGIPEGTTIKDGNEILPKEEIFTYSNSKAGKSSVSAFSNIFRFKLLYLRGNYWVDTDMVCTQFLNFSEEFLFTTEPKTNKGYSKEKINAGVIKLPIFSKPALFGFNRCQRIKKKILSGEIKWGLGPKTVQVIVNQFELREFVKPWYFSNSCGCVHWKSLLENFNWKFYLKKYPELKKKEIKTREKATEHWNKFGKEEGKLGVPYQKYALLNLKDKPEGNYCIHLWNQFWNKDGMNKNASYTKDCLFEQLKEIYL